MMENREMIKLDGFDVSVKVVSVPKYWQKCMVKPRQDCLPRIQTPRAGFAIIVTPNNNSNSNQNPSNNNQNPSNNVNKCPASYNKNSFGGNTAQIAFYNEWDVPVKVILYHPNTGQIFNSYTVSPKQNNFLGDNIIIGDDWGVCFENRPNSSGIVNNVGSISDYNPDWQGKPLFMIQNNRIQ